MRQRARRNLLIITAIVPMVEAAVVVSGGTAVLDWLWHPKWYIWLTVSPLVYLIWLVICLVFAAGSSRKIAARNPKPRHVTVQTGRSVEQVSDPGAATVAVLGYRFEFVTSLPLVRLFQSTPRLKRLVLRAYSPSVSIGEDALIFGTLEDPDLTEIGSGAIIGWSSELIAHALTRRPDGKLAYVSAPIKVGKGATVGGSAYVSLGSVIGDGAVVEPLSFVAPFTRIPAGETWGGNPARCVRQANGVAPDAGIAQPVTATHLPVPAEVAGSSYQPTEGELEQARRLAIFALGLTVAGAPADLSADTCAAWDSIGQVSIATALYDSYGIAVDNHSLFRLRTLRDIAGVLAGNDTVSGRAITRPVDSQVRRAIAIPADIEMLPLMDAGEATRALAERYLDSPPARTAVRVVIAASSLARAVESPMRAWGRAFGLEIESVFAGFNQVAQTLLSPSSDFAANAGGVNVVLVDPSDRCFDHGGEASAGVEQLLSALELWASRQPQGSQTLVGTLPPLVSRFASIDKSLYEELRHRWRTRIASIAGIRVFDFAGVIEQLGAEAAQNSEGEVISRMAYSAALYQTLGIALVREILSTRRNPVKVVAVDCDNTLWGGVVGEAGLDGIQLGQDGIGRSYQLFQRYLKQLKDRGLLLVIVSKNEEADVLRVFDNHPEMVLRRSDIAAWKVNWKHKSENLQELAEELNLGIDSFVFLDDDAAVRSEVSMRLPSIHVVPMPENPSHYCDAVQKLWLFDGAQATEADLMRTRRMQEEFARRSVRQSAASLEDYLSDLNLEVEIRPPLETEWPRIAQLTQRTNQFNLSLKRRTLEEVRAMANDGFVLALKARDRFGDYGLVGACVGIITEPGVCEIDTFLMSCRVLGRGVENSLLHAVAIYARQQGSELLAAPFIAGPRNQMVREFLARSGFREQGENRWELPITEIPDLPSHVSWVDAEPASPPETAATGGV